MRHARLLPPLLLAFTVAACAGQQQPYYVTDSMTGQRVVAGQETTPQSARGVFASNTPQAGPASAYAAPQANAGRGLFSSNLFNSSSPAPNYAYQPAQPLAPQTYSYRPPRQQGQAGWQAPPSPAMQYRPPPQPAPPTYAQPAYAAQRYQAAQPQPGGYYAERYRWY